jgi:hypothetical protein
VGLQVRALKLACHLNAGKVTSGMLAGLAWNTMAVVSAPVGAASCLVDGQDLQADATQVLDFPKQRVTVGCVGDVAGKRSCSLRGQLVCR